MFAIARRPGLLHACLLLLLVAVARAGEPPPGRREDPFLSDHHVPGKSSVGDAPPGWTPVGTARVSGEDQANSDVVPAGFSRIEQLDEPSSAVVPAAQTLPAPATSDPDDVFVDPGQFQAMDFENQAQAQQVGIDFYGPGDFDGIIVRGKDVALKIGGYVKADVIQDFDPIASEDFFATQTIEIGAPDRNNSRFHARQSRLNFDVRWDSDLGDVRTFVEGDFFSDGNRFRLRHAYGEVGPIIVGQTWSTFADVRSLPNTLDFEGPASVNRRQAQIRWTGDLPWDALTWSVSVEDPDIVTNLDGLPPGVRLLNESPDFAARVRYRTEASSFQAATVLRRVGAQVRGVETAAETAWGVNLTGSQQLGERDDVYFQVTFGEGVGSYRNVPDIVIGGTQGQLLPVFAWLVGLTHEWRDDLSSNFTYSESILDNAPFEGGDALHLNTYLAANLIWQPTERFFVGIEYLFGIRENVDGANRSAQRLQSSFGFYLP